MPEEEKTLAETSDPDLINSLIQAIQIHRLHSGLKCRCWGNPSFEFYRGDELVASVSFHHGTSFRWEGWTGDGYLTEYSACHVKEWLAARGITDLDNIEDPSTAKSLRKLEALEHPLEIAPTPRLLSKE